MSLKISADKERKKRYSASLHSTALIFLDMTNFPDMTPQNRTNHLPSVQPPDDGAEQVGEKIRKSCLCIPVGVGEFLITGLFCSPLVARKISTTAPCVRERIPMILKQRRKAS